MKNGIARAMLVGTILGACPRSASGSMLVGVGLSEEKARVLPAYNIPRMTKPPTIDGAIEPDEWREAVQLSGGGVNGNPWLYVRPVTFWWAWDDEHLYVACRSGINPGEKLTKFKRERYTAGVVLDDSYEFGLFMGDRNRKAGEVSSFFKFIVNSLHSGEYIKMYPDIGQYVYNWRPEQRIACRVTPDGKWWEMEQAFHLKDLEMPVKNKVGDVVRLLMARNYHNPDWVQCNVPVAKGFMAHDGFTHATLTDNAPYAQMQEFSGLNEGRLALRCAVYNPSDRPVKVRALCTVRQGGGAVTNAEPPMIEERVLDVPARGMARFDVTREKLPVVFDKQQKYGVFDVRITPADDPDALPLLSTHFPFTDNFAGICSVAEVKRHFVSSPPPPFQLSSQFNPVRNNLWLAGDTLDAEIPEGSRSVGLRYEARQGDTTVAQGTLDRLVTGMYQGMVTIPDLKPGSYSLVGSLVDEAGKTLISATNTFAKKDEAKEFSAWWGNRIGNTEKVLRPFTALKVSGNKVSCVLRDYELDALGLPRRIVSRGGDVLAKPARLIVTVGGKEHAVALEGAARITEAKDWRVSFEGAAEAAGVRFSTRGTIEQDGLVELALTYTPVKDPVAVEALRIEWPVDDALENRMICIGVGGNYSARQIGAIPKGNGVVWDTLNDMGPAGSGMTVGNCYPQVWVGTEQRGLLWAADSDEGWAPRDDVAAHELLREKGQVILRNHLIGRPRGKHAAANDAGFVLNEPRTVHFAYMASPFRPWEPGWRLMLRSAANGFSKPGFKISRDGKLDGWAKLTPPSRDLGEWPSYYAEYKETADTMARQAAWDPEARYTMFACNQIPLRGYDSKTTEPGVYDYFQTEWLTFGSETLTPTYNDYVAHLKNRWIKEGGLRAFYYDISMVVAIASPWNGHGYFLPDGRIQPGGGQGNLRRHVMRDVAMMQENGLYPPGMSGHATQAFPLMALPWYDAMLDSEFSMLDPMDTYPMERMIAMSCPHNFGVQIDHLGHMNPHWAMIHDAGMGAGHGAVYLQPEFRNWGFGQADVEFIPYWRNRRAVKKIGDGLIASIWKRPHSLVMALMNYGPDPAGKETMRRAALTLDLEGLGIPRGLTGERLRVRELEWSRKLATRYIGYLAWVKELKDGLRPDIAPTLDPKTGALGGFEIGYHDQRYLVVSWDDRPIADAAWKADFDAASRPLALEWGINRARALTADEVARAALVTNEAVTVKAWVQPNTVWLRFANGSTNTAQTVTAKLDRAALGIEASPEKLFQEFTITFDPLRQGAALANMKLEPGAARHLCIGKD